MKLLSKQIGTYWKTFYKTGKIQNEQIHNMMTVEMRAMLTDAVENQNATFEYGTHISKTDTMTYVIVAKRNNPPFPDAPYVVWNYDATNNGLYNGYYDIDTYDNAKHIAEQRQSL